MIKQKKARFAFEYNRNVIESDIDWFKRFEILVPGYIFEKDLRKEFQNSGTELICYEWATGSYVNHKISFTEYIAKYHPGWFLNEQPLKTKYGPAWFYDMANPELQEKRADHLARVLKWNGYDGFFFDCITLREDHAEGIENVIEEYNKRHPDIKETIAISNFFKLLRQKLPNKKIFTNQAYQSPSLVAPSHYDLSESYMTSWANAKELNSQKLTHFLSWNNKDEPWKSTRHVITNCILPHIKTGTEIMHLNYSFPIIDPNTQQKFPDKEAIYYSLAAAYLFGHTAYTRNQECPSDPCLNHDEIYFVDIGKPKTNIIHFSDQFSYREFENVVVAVNGTGSSQYLRMDGEFINLFTGEQTRNNKLIVPINTQLNGTLTPSARIFHNLSKT